MARNKERMFESEIEQKFLDGKSKNSMEWEVSNMFK